jgi:NADH:ubiquinone oxidoreductase subunit E
MDTKTISIHSNKGDGAVSADEKEKIKRIFVQLSDVSLSYNQETVVQSLEEYFEEHGYLSGKQKTLLIDIYEQVG